MIFVNDASTDGSQELLMELAVDHNDIRILKMSRNFGVFPCTFAGFQHASGDIVIYMDSDLQDPPEVIPKLIKKNYKFITTFILFYHVCKLIRKICLYIYIIVLISII